MVALPGAQRGSGRAHARHRSPCVLRDRETCRHEKGPDSGSLMGAPLWPGAPGGLCPCLCHPAGPCGLLSGVRLQPAAEPASATPRQLGTGASGRGQPAPPWQGTPRAGACHVQPSGISERGSGPRGPCVGGGLGPSLTRAFRKPGLSRDQSARPGATSLAGTSGRCLKRRWWRVAILWLCPQATPCSLQASTGGLPGPRTRRPGLRQDSAHSGHRPEGPHPGDRTSPAGSSGPAPGPRARPGEACSPCACQGPRSPRVCTAQPVHRAATPDAWRSPSTTSSPLLSSSACGRDGVRGEGAPGGSTPQGPRCPLSTSPAGPALHPRSQQVSPGHCFASPAPRHTYTRCGRELRLRPCRPRRSSLNSQRERGSELCSWSLHLASTTPPRLHGVRVVGTARSRTATPPGARHAQLRPRPRSSAPRPRPHPHAARSHSPGWGLVCKELGIA